MQSNETNQPTNTRDVVTILEELIHILSDRFDSLVRRNVFSNGVSIYFLPNKLTQLPMVHVGGTGDSVRSQLC